MHRHTGNATPDQLHDPTTRKIICRNSLQSGKNKRMVGHKQILSALRRTVNDLICCIQSKMNPTDPALRITNQQTDIVPLHRRRKRTSGVNQF